jgi:hypothetical protein
MRAASVTVTGVATSLALVPDAYTVGDGVSLQFTPGAGATASVQGTLDDIFDPLVVPAWVDLPIAALIGATTNQLQFVQSPVRAFRLNQTVGATLSKLTVLQRGII